MKSYGLIYLAKNKVNGKVYVGQTVLTLEEKIKEYKCKEQYSFVRYFLRALRKHSFDSFEWSCIVEAQNQEELDNLERYWIAHYNSTDSNNGYNLESGGLSGKRPTNASKAKHRETIRKKIEAGWVSPKKGRKTGLPAWNRGLKQSKESIEKALQTRLMKYGSYKVPNSGRKKGQKGGRIRPIICIELDLKFESLLQAAEHFQCHSSSLCAALKGKTKTCAGYTWRYLESSPEQLTAQPILSNAA